MKSDDVEVLATALTDGLGTWREPIPSLLSVAAEVVGALADCRLSSAERDRIYVEAVRLVEETILGGTRSWPVRLHLNRRTSAVLGSVAVGGVTAVGLAVAHARRHRPDGATVAAVALRRARRSRRGRHRG